MLDLKINGRIPQEVKNKIKFIESIANAKWNINIKWNIKEEFLDSMLIQLVLLDKSKEDSFDFKWDGEKLGFKKKKDPKFSFMNLKWEDWKDWKDWKDWLNGVNWIDGKDWINGIDWINGLNGLNWIDWTDWVDWVDWKDWINWASLEYDFRNDELWIRLKGETEFNYVNIRWPRWVKGFSWDKWDSANATSTTLTAGTYNLDTVFWTIYCDTSGGQVNLNLPNAWLNKDIPYYVKKITTDSNLVSIIPQSWLIEDETTVELDDNQWFLFSTDWTNWFSLNW